MRKSLAKLFDIVQETFYHSGRLFTPRRDGLTGELARLMTQYGVQDVQTRTHTVVYAAGTEIGQYFYEDMQSMFRVLLPFFLRWTRVPSNYEEIYQQALKEMQQPEFAATMTILTVWGKTPESGELVFMRGLR